MSSAKLYLLVTVIIERDDDKWFGHCPAFSGLLMDGKTIDETLQRVRDGLDVYLESLERHGDPLPIGKDCAILLHEPKPEPLPKAVKKRTTRRLPVPCPAFATA